MIRNMSIISSIYQNPLLLHMLDHFFLLFLLVQVARISWCLYKHHILCGGNMIGMIKNMSIISSIYLNLLLQLFLQALWPSPIGNCPRLQGIVSSCSIFSFPIGNCVFSIFAITLFHRPDHYSYLTRPYINRLSKNELR